MQMLRHALPTGRLLSRSRSFVYLRGEAGLFPNANVRYYSTHLSSVSDSEERAKSGNVTDMLALGRQFFDQHVPEKAEYWLTKAAELDNLEAQYLAGVLLVSTPHKKSVSSSASIQDSTTVTVEASNASEVRSQIMKLRKESMFEKRSSNKSNLDDFNEALRRRKEKLEQQNNPTSTTNVPVEPATAVTAPKAVDNRTKGMKWLKRAAQGGHGQAMCYLGNELLRDGQKIVTGDLPKNTPQDVSKASRLIHQAIDWYSLSVRDARVGAAAYNLGVLFHDGVEHTSSRAVRTEEPVVPDLMVTKVSFKAGQATESAQKATVPPTPSTTSAADSADVKTTTIVPVNLDASLQYFLQAAELGEPAALLWCGYCYCTEEGGVTQVDPVKAVRFLQSACQHPETAAKAHFYLAQIYRSGLSSGAEEEREGGDLEADQGLFLLHLLEAVQGGEEDAVYLLADLHLQRHFAMEQSEEREEGDKSEEEEQKDKEVAFLQADLAGAPNPLHRPHASPAASAAPHVHSDSCGSSCGHDHHDHAHSHAHSHAHDHGHEVYNSHESHQSLNLDHSPTPIELASSPTILSKQHLLRAVTLLVQASAAGQAEATLTLGALTYQGKLPPQRDTDGAPISNKRRAFELYQLAAEQGSTDAWRNVASMHFLGDGVPKSEELAKEIMKVVFGKK